MSTRKESTLLEKIKTCVAGAAFVGFFGMAIIILTGNERIIQSEARIHSDQVRALASEIFEERCQTELKYIVEVVAYINGRGPPQSALEEAARRLAQSS